MKILDCTIRDGGYYTNWDFDKNLVDIYIESINNLPIEYIEVGYRSFTQKEYLGEYFYLPLYVMKHLKETTSKKLVVILNEKDVRAQDVKELLTPCLGLITMVRLAIDPENLERAIGLAKVVKSMGFEVGFNVMYMSKWKQYGSFLDLLPKIKGVADYFYMVDSYGGVYPNDVKETIEMVRSKVDVPLGFHGHNNMELALINTLTAIENGVDIVDVTITGMGRGAGNLKTELLLTALNAKGQLDIDFNVLSKVVDGFTNLQKEYEWGTNLPYMVSGANSLPQKDVMDWVGKRYYSLNSIIRALSNQSKGIKDNEKLNNFNPNFTINQVLIVGGGPSVKYHSEAIKNYIEKNPDVLIIHASSKNVQYFEKINNLQCHCLAGNEGYRLESIFNNMSIENHIAILPPYPRTMGTYIPAVLKNKASQIESIRFTEQHRDSVTSIILQLVLDLKISDVLICGFDGYSGSISRHQLELFNENEFLFSKYISLADSITSITPTSYESLKSDSIYSMI